MNDINQMELGFEEYTDLPHSKIPDFGNFLQKRLEQDKSVNPGNFDPHALMVKKKEIEKGEKEDTTPKQTWPEKDIKVLDDFCKKYGIMGFSCGRMSPIAALSMLKQQLGIVDGPIENRIPTGYEKIGLKPTKFNSSFPYEEMVRKKTLLHG